MTNFHTHTTFCDGKNTPEEMVEAALAKGFTALGFSSHSEMLKDARTYIARIRNVAELYRGRLSVYCGIEADAAVFPEGTARDDYDYAIGSVHFVKAADGSSVPVDWSPERFAEDLKSHFNGDGEAFIREYFSEERKMLAKGGFEILGHPDLVRKFNAKTPWFDENAVWYKGELEAMADAVAKSGVIVEVNTGAISRGWLDDAYPSPFFRSLLRARGVRFILSSDTHSASTIDCAFDRFADGENYVSTPWLNC